MINPLSLLYGLVMSSRNRLYDSRILPSYRSTLPVISIGNVTAGGNAKTPLSLYVAKELSAKGYKPVILSRGYGGTERGPSLVTDNNTYSEVGDEPLLLHKLGLKVVVSRARAEGAKLIEREDYGNVIVLDDGFQHRALHRNLDIVSIDVSSSRAIQSILEGKLLPGGLFREPRDSAFKRAGMIVLSERRPRSVSPKEAPREILDLLPYSVPIFRSFYELDGVFSLKTRERLSPQPVVAFCGIAKPDAFYSSLASLGFTIIECRSFTDHHSFSDGEIEDLYRKFPGTPLVCTEKDGIRVGSREGIWELRISPRVHPSDAFSASIIRSLIRDTN